VNRQTKNEEHLTQLYRERAKGYDASGIQSLNVWRKEAVRLLDLKPGAVVIDIGCGTGLNFPLLQEAVGAEGRIIGVDLTDAMLDQARQRVTEHGWKNVELIQNDAARYSFPAQVDGIISTFALTFIPDCGRVIENGCKTLAHGRKWVVLDMAWPDGLPLGLRQILFFLPAYGITADVIERRAWVTVRQTMEQHLVNVVYKPFWSGFFYLAQGTQVG
jgi:ubiquinone/menaquinone biosynthesis C-methylase UbiE